MEYDPMCGFAPAKAPEHYDGEPFTGRRSIWCSDVYAEDKYRLEFTGERRDVEYGEYATLFLAGNEAFRGGNGGGCAQEKAWILRAVPVEPPAPAWKKGDYAFDTARDDYGIVEVGDVWNKGVSVWVRSLAANLNRTAKYSDLRPLTPADWTREIGTSSVKIRAYERDNGGVDLRCSGFSYVDWSLGPEGEREFCRLAGLPVMPYALHQGRMDPPE